MAASYKDCNADIEKHMEDLWREFDISIEQFCFIQML